MIKKAALMGALILSVIQTNPAMGTLVEVSVTTDKPTYLLGEEIGISIIAFNPNNYEVILEFWESWTDTSYCIDNSICPICGAGGFPPIVIPQLSTHTWHHDYLTGFSSQYPLLEIGVHSVVGAVNIEPPIQSEPFEFTVVPEPCTLSLLTLGGLALLRKRRT